MDDKEMYFQAKQTEYVKRLRRKNQKYALLSAASLIVFLIIWQLLVTLGVLSLALPSPLDVIRAGLAKISSRVPDGNTLGTNIIESGKVTLLGFILAAGIGIPLGLLMGWFTSIDRFVNPVFELIRPIPPIAMIPIIVVLLGVNIKARATIIFLSSFISCVLNSYAGIKMTNQTLINVAKTFGASNFETFWKIGIPSAMPMSFTGARLALASSWGTLVAAEMLASNAGLGNMLNCARNTSNIALVIFSMLLIGGIGAIFSGVVDSVERHRLQWKMGDKR